MSKYLNKTVAFLLVLIFIISNCIIASAETSYTKGYITIYNVSNSESISYEAIDVNGELFVSLDDIAKIINMEATNCEDSVFYSNYYANRSIDVCFDGSIWTRGITYKATVHNVDETYYFPLEIMLYLANAQWCVENNIVYVQLTDNTILDFIDAYCMEILDNNITQTELLMNGESELSNAAKSSFAAIFNDFDVRVFVPIWGAITLTVEDYQNAMLQLAKDELEFIDEYGQSNLDNLLEESSFLEIKSIWDDAQSVADLPENILTATDYVNQTYLWIKDTKNGTKMFSEYNNLADFTPAEIGAISKELQGISDILTIANAIVNVNEIATRSKSWNEDFLAQIELLTDFDETGYNKSMVNYIKKASTSLLEEHADTFSATTDACVEETLKVLGEKLVDLTPAGTLTSIITTGLSVAKLLDEDFAASFDALELSNMVEWLIRIEHVAFTEMARDIQTMRMNSLNGGSTLEELTELRNTTMLALRTNLRNKVFIYYLNTVRNNDSSWVNSNEAKEIEQDILWNYAKIIELGECEPFDRLLVLDGFENMYSDEYGCKRDKINADILSDYASENMLTDLKQTLIEQYGLASQEQFVSCLGSEIQTYPSSIYGIVSMIDLDLNNDKTNELVVLRVSQTDNNEEAQIIAEVYQPNGSEPYLCTSQTVYNISFCTASNIYLFYSDILSKYCIMVDSYSSGSYTGVNSWSAKVYTITSNSIDEYRNWESVPFVGINADFESEFKTINAPYAKYCTTFDNRNNTSYYQPLCEVEHEIFGDPSTYMTRNHKLKIKSSTGQENTTADDNSMVVDCYKTELLNHPESISHTYGTKTVYVDTEYTVYDIDKDGVFELIIKEDSDNYFVYTYDNGECKQCGKFYWNYADCLYEYNENGLVVYDGGVGSLHLEYVYLYSLSNGVLNMTDTIISSEEYSLEEVRSTLEDYTAINDFYPISDYTLLIP